ncbi:hypothetical protein [Ralstonia thomasii]|uniref:hypothetical protein n=1 Tax=Ralstonia thomasii TaxID=3058596 RepID=UPI002931CEBA|nr:hypothetical protein [Ralstonia sp. LMG 18095]
MTQVQGWRPIETAPKDNTRQLYLARFDAAGKLQEIDFDGSWEYWQESWELPHINGYYWCSAHGIEDPTHWAYQDEPFPSVPVALRYDVLQDFASAKGLDYNELCRTVRAAFERAAKEGAAI